MAPFGRSRKNKPSSSKIDRAIRKSSVGPVFHKAVFGPTSAAQRSVNRVGGNGVNRQKIAEQVRNQLQEDRDPGEGPG